MYLFGSGELYLKPFGPNAAGNPTPQKLGTMQEVSVEISASQKELYGKNQFPVAIARTAGKINMKAKFANINAKTCNDLFFGNTVAVGSKRGMIDEAHTAGASVTIAPPSSGVFAEDFGVVDATTGKQMTKVVSGAAAGVSYQVNEGTGVYTFNASQGATLISYSFTVSTLGASSNVTNKPMGSMPIFEANLVNNQFQSANNSVNSYLQFPNCIAAKFSMPFKNEDFTVVEFDFSAFSDAAGNIFYLNLDE